MNVVILLHNLIFTIYLSLRHDILGAQVMAEMRVKIIDQNICSDYLKSKKFLPLKTFKQLQEYHICANESMSPVLNCKGSGGAPLITSINLDGNSENQMPYAFGVSSAGWGCGLLSIHTRISSFIDWIEQKVFNSTQSNPSHLKDKDTDINISKSEERLDPCNYDKFEHLKPKSNKVGRRVSDIKCEEYSWYYWAEFLESQRNEIACQDKLGATISRIYRGDRAQQGDFPHMGAVGWRFPNSTEIKFLCGSTLISPKFALSAGHCWKAPDKHFEDRNEPYLVRFGNVYIGSQIDDTLYGSKDVLIAKFLTLSEYKEHPTWKYNDIALIELEEELDILLNIRPACLWNGGLGNNWVANVTGWGTTEDGLKTNHLNYANVNFIDKPSCNNYLSNRYNRNWKNGLVDHQFCAGKLEGGVDTCQGDLGGPLQIIRPMPMGLPGEVHYVVGVTSFGIACGHPLLPSIYTNITSFLCWIEKTVWPEENNEFCP